MRTFAWRWSDPSHLDAHRRDFHLPPDDVLARLRPLVEAHRPAAAAIETAFRRDQPIVFHRDFELETVVGVTGLRPVAPDGRDSFWGYREGRMVPSHLCLGEKETTRWVCLWGTWTPDEFVIYTLYPGHVAPREIHDPAIALDELPAAIEFWRKHAIVVTKEEYWTTPNR